MTCELYEMALAISHICRWETDMFRMGWLRFTVMPSLRKSSEAFFFIPPSSTMPAPFVG